MNETDPRIRQTPEARTTAPWTPAGQPDPLLRGAYAVGTDAGSFAEGEEALPEDDARERVIHRGSFASGGEEMPEENAERRIHARGGFAVGEETTPDEDAEARMHPGTFADSEPSA